MVEDTSCFPRGGRTTADDQQQGAGKPAGDRPKRNATQVDKPKRKKFNDSDSEAEASGGEENQQPTVLTRRKKQKTSGKQLAAVEGVWVDKLDAATAAAGTLMLAAVKSVSSGHVDVELADGMQGRVAAQAVNSHVQLAVTPLQSLLQPGQLCVVTSHGVTPGASSAYLSLTMDPTATNRSLDVSCLRPHMLINGAVKSVEEKGYIVDVGLHSEGFVPVDACARALCVGQPLLCSLLQAPGEHSRVIRLTPAATCNLEDGDLSQLQKHQMLPGQCFAATVDTENEMSTGVIVHLNEYVKAFVHRNKLPSKYQFDMQLLTQESAARCLPVVVTYTRPHSNILALSAKPHLMRHDQPGQLQQTYAVGQVLSAQVLLRTPADHVYLTVDGAHKKQSKKNKAASSGAADVQILVKRRELDVAATDGSEQVAAKYAAGSKHECKVLNVNQMEALVTASCRPEVIKQKFVAASQAQPGAKVSCCVVGCGANGVQLRINQRINAFLPILHSADQPLAPSKLDLVFHKDAVISCRVLYHDSTHDSVVVTHKKSLVKSGLAPIAQYDAGNVKRRALAVVVNQPTSKGCLVTFYNQVKAWCKSTQWRSLSVGQVITVQVASVEVDRHKMIVLHLPQNNADQADGKPAQAKASDVAGSVSVVDGTWLRVCTKRQGVVLVNKHQLTDCLQPQPLDTYAQYFQTHPPKFVYMSERPSGESEVCTKSLVVNWCKEKQQPMAFESLEAGRLCAGVVTSRHAEFGLFIALPSQRSQPPITALAPYGHIDGGKRTTCTVGQTVLAKIDKVDLAKRRVSLMMKTRFCYPPGQAPETLGLTLLNEWLNWQCRAAQLCEKSRPYPRVGECVTVRIESLHETLGATVSLVNQADYEGLNGVVTKAHLDMQHTYKIGQTHQACVLGVDFPALSLELSFWSELLTPELNEQKHEIAAVKMVPDGMVKALVVCNKPDYTLLAVRPAPGLGYSRQYLALLPSRLHPNQPAPELGRYELSKQISVLLRQRYTAEDSRLFCLAHTQLWTCIAESDVAQLSTFVVTPKADQQQDVKPSVLVLDRSKAKKHLVGEMVRAQVTGAVSQGAHQSTYVALQLPGTAHGCLHPSELPKRYLQQTGSMPVQKFLEDFTGKTIDVKIISKTRDKKTKSAQRISSAQRSLVHIHHCSANEDKLRAHTGKKKQIGYAEKFTVGSIIEAAIVTHVDAQRLKVDVNAHWSGQVRQLHTSTDVQVVNSLGAHFKVGQLVKQLTVIGSDRRHNSLILSLLDRAEQYVSESRACLGCVSVLQPKPNAASDLSVLCRVTLPSGAQGLLGATELSHNYTQIAATLSSLSTGKCIRVLPLQSLPANKWIVTCRDDLLAAADTADNESSAADDVPAKRRRTRSTSGCSDTSSAHAPNRLVQSAQQLAVGDELLAFVNDKHAVYLGRGVLGKVTDSAALKNVQRARVVRVRVEEIEGTGATAADDDDDDSGLKCAVRVALLQVEDAVEPAAKKSRRPDLTPPVVDANTQLPRFEQVVAEKRTSPLKNPTGVVQLQAQTDASDKDASATAGSFDWEPAAFAPRGFVDVSLSVAADSSSATQTGSSSKTPAPTDAAIKQFDQLLMDEPNSAELWLRYVHMFSDAGDFERARATAQRALQGIDYRQETERQRVWLAWFGLEVQHGTTEQQQQVLAEARRNCDELAICRQAAGALHTHGKTQECDELLEEMQRRFKSESGVVDLWVQSGEHYMRTGRPALSHQTLQKALSALPKTLHVQLLTRFGALELREGDAERGKTLFESLLANYPKRTDVWLTYIDLTTKHIGVEQARYLLERATSLPLGSHRMKALFKKWQQFEEKHGDAEAREDVKRRAAEYVESVRHSLQLPGQ